MMVPAITCRIMAAFAPIGRIGTDLRAVFANKRYLLVVAARLAQGIGQGGVAAGSIYYLTQLLGVDLEHLSYNVMFAFAGAGVGQIFWVYLAARIGRTTAYSMAILLLIAEICTMLAVPPGNFPIIFSMAVWSGICSAGVSLMSLSILTDVINLDRQETGGRVAMFSSFYALTEKLAVTIGAFFVANVLSFGGFLETHGRTPVVQSASALVAVRIAYVGIATAGLSVAFLISLAIGRSVSRQVRAAIAV